MNKPIHDTMTMLQTMTYKRSLKIPKE